MSTDLVKHIEELTPKIERLLPAHVKPERMVRLAMGTLRNTPKLRECAPQSFLGSLMQASVLGLEPDNGLGHCYILPYKGQAKLIIGYTGMLDLAMRSGIVSTVEGRCVYDADEFVFSFGTDPGIHHIPAEERDESDRCLTYTYAVVTMRDGSKQFEVLSRQAIDKTMASSPGAKRSDSPWRTAFPAMAKKTALRRLFKWLPVSPEIRRAVALDEMADAGLRQRFDTDVEGVVGDAPEGTRTDALNAALEDDPPSEEPKEVEAEVLDEVPADVSEQDIPGLT